MSLYVNVRSEAKRTISSPSSLFTSSLLTYLDHFKICSEICSVHEIELGEILIGFVGVVVDETWVSRLLQRLEETNIKFTCNNLVHLIAKMITINLVHL